MKTRIILKLGMSECLNCGAVGNVVYDGKYFKCKVCGGNLKLHTPTPTPDELGGKHE